ncbi:MAG: MATE family efflux transporter [Deltaproteobacteria bacterium]|nr:MATE family efflux transporter [Deltaproteobacteria bacterium]
MEDHVGFGGKTGLSGKDWTEGHIFTNLMKLYWPMAVTNILTMLGPTIDMVWVGKLGSASVAGVGAAGIAVQLTVTSTMGLSLGLRALIARFIGAKDMPGANHTAQQGLLLSAFFGLFIALVGVFFAEPILNLLRLRPEVVREGAAYLRVMFIGMGAMSFRVMTEGVMQASGDTVTPMKISVVYRLLHVALCPFLVFGLWIFPRLGVSGAAATNILSQTTAVLLGLWVLFRGRTRLRLTLRHFRVDLRMIWRIIRIGVPAIVSGAQRTFSHFFLLLFIAPFGTAAVAAHTINQRMEVILFMNSMAFGMSAGVLVGQNLGALKPDRAEKSAWIAVALVEMMVIAASAAILIWAEGIVCIFNAEPEVVEVGGKFMRIAVAGFVVMGFVAVGMQSLAGAGDTMPTMIISLITMWGITLPLAYLLPRVTDMGVYGIRWAMSAGMVFGAIVFTTYFRMGRWKRRKV